MKIRLMAASLLLLAGCKGAPSNSAIECYYVAEYKSSEPLSSIVDELRATYLEISDAHYAGELLHIPLAHNRKLYFGGLCHETAVWVTKLKRNYKISTVTEEVFDFELSRARGE